MKFTLAPTSSCIGKCTSVHGCMHAPTHIHTHIIHMYTYILYILHTHTHNTTIAPCTYLQTPHMPKSTHYQSLHIWAESTSDGTDRIFLKSFENSHFSECAHTYSVTRPSVPQIRSWTVLVALVHFSTAVLILFYLSALTRIGPGRGNVS